MFDMTDAEITNALKAIGYTDRDVELTLKLKLIASPKLNWLIKAADLFSQGNVEAFTVALTCPWLNPISFDRESALLEQLRIRLSFEQAQVALNDLHAHKEEAA